MEKEFIPYKQALALKELGFDEPCLGCYYKDKTFAYHPDSDVFANAPTFSQAFRWFREKYNISHSIDWMTRSLKLYSGYYVHFRGINNTKINQDNYIVLNDELPLEGYRVYETYEEAELECLKKLIEICNQI